MVSQFQTNNLDFECFQKLGVQYSGGPNTEHSNSENSNSESIRKPNVLKVGNQMVKTIQNPNKRAAMF